MSQLVDAYEKLSDRTSVQPSTYHARVVLYWYFFRRNKHPDCHCTEINHFGYTKIPTRCQAKKALLV